MRPRERVLTALRRQPPDRVPYFIRFTAPQLENLQQRTGVADPAAYFDTDIRDVAIDTSEHPPDYSRYLAGKPEGTYVDDDGVAKFQGDFLHYWRIVPLLDGATSVQDIEDYPIPDFAAPYRYEGFRGRVRSLQKAGYAVRGRPGSLFEWAWQVRGFDNLFLDFAERPELAECLLDRRTEVLSGAAQLHAQCGVDVLGLHDDVAMQTGPIMSLSTWRRWFKPRMAKVIAAAKRVRPDILVWYHCDGDATAFLPELIEIGVDIMNPIQPECMDGEEVKRQFGDRLAFWGGLGTQSVLPFGSPEDVRKEVARLVATLGRGGGLLLEPTHQVQPDVPWENIVAYVEAARAAVYA